MTGSRGITHGRATTYVYGKCRCIPCRDAARLAEQLRREHKARRLRADPSLAPHGVPNTYSNWGCRCAPCKRANTDRCLVHQRAKRRAGVTT